MKIKLTVNGMIKYKKRREYLQPSDKEQDQRGSKTAKRGKGRLLSNTDIADRMRKLGFQWDFYHVSRFFNSKPKYPFTEPEAKAISEIILEIPFDLNDYEEKQGHTLVYVPFLKQTDPSGKRFDDGEGRKDDEGDPEDNELVDQQPCNPVALRAEVSDGSIPDPFASLDFHLKVSVEETHASMLRLPSRARMDAASLSCRIQYSLYQGNDAIDLTRIDEVRTNPVCFEYDDLSPLIDEVKQLKRIAVRACRGRFMDTPTPRLYLHIMLPVSWLSGPLPQAILTQLGLQVFFGCSGRESLDNSVSAVFQHHENAANVNRKLHPGHPLSRLEWATVCQDAAPPADLFPRPDQVLHRDARILDGEVDHRQLVGRDALLAAERKLLFVEGFSDAAEGSTEGSLDQRWRRLVEIGLPLVFWWRCDEALAKSASLDRLRDVLKGSWSEFCDTLQLMARNLNPEDTENEEKKRLLANLGIFYEEPLRHLEPAPYHHPIHPAP